MQQTPREKLLRVFQQAGLPQFELDTDGFPVPGPVIRYYREQMKYVNINGRKKHWTQADLAQRLGVSTVLVHKMETTNYGLDSIDRRRALASILKIPPALLGLASLSDLLDAMQYTSKSRKYELSPNTLRLFQDAFSVYSQMYVAGTEQDAIPDIEEWISKIHTALEQSSMPKQELLQILWRFHALCVKIYGEDTYNWLNASNHLNASLDIATTLQNSDMLASTLYRSSAVHVARQNYALAKADIDGAAIYAKNAQPYIKGAILLDSALIYAMQDSDSSRLVYKLLEQAEHYSPESNNDGIMNYGRGKFLLIKARTLLALKRPEKALECLDYAQENINSQECRRLAFLDIMRAECYLKHQRPEYDTALILLADALSVSKGIHSTFNIKHVKRLSNILEQSPYTNSPDVADLRLALRGE